jgi:flagellar biosynthesis protein FlhA
MPPVRILDNMQLEANATASRSRRSMPAAAIVYPGQLMVMDPMGGQVDLPGHPHHRADLRPARHLDRRRRCATRRLRGYTVVDPATVISTHLTEVLKANMADLLSATPRCRSCWRPAQGPAEAGRGHRARQISVSGIQRVLQTLLPSASRSATCRPSSRASPKSPAPARPRR